MSKKKERTNIRTEIGTERERGEREEREMCTERRERFVETTNTRKKKKFRHWGVLYVRYILAYFK